MLAEGQVEEVVLLVEWLRPLHLVVVVDHLRREERILTVYEPENERWRANFRSRR